MDLRGTRAAYAARPVFLRCLARFKAGATVESARAELQETARRVQLAHPELAAPEYGYVTVLLAEELLGKVLPERLIGSRLAAGRAHAGATRSA